MTLTFSRLRCAEQHAVVLLDDLAQALDQGGGELHARFPCQLRVGNTVRRHGHEDQELADEIEIRPADVDVVVGLAHAINGVLRQLPRQNGHHRGQRRAGAPALSMETAANPDSH